MKKPRSRTDLPPDLYPEDPWALVEDSFAPRFLYLTETIFALSNGYLGVRATLEEGEPAHAAGTFINGFHETWRILHPEAGHGFAETGQTIVNLPDATIIALSVDGEPLHAARATRFRRWLDFRNGVLERVSEWVTESGVEVRMWSKRLVSLTHPGLMAARMAIEVDRPARLGITSRVVNRHDPPAVDYRLLHDPRRASWLPYRVLVPRSAEVSDGRLVQSWVTANSRLPLVTGVDHLVEGIDVDPTHRQGPDVHTFEWRAEVERGREVSVTKLAVYAAGSKDRREVEDTLDSVCHIGFEKLEAAHSQAFEQFWETADVEVEAAPEIQRAARWCLFHLRQASAHLDGHGIPAKGLTGNAYDGHYFWDTEIFVLPFLTYVDPQAAAQLVRFRYGLLPAARRRATQLSQKGALYPWRTINGDEASAYFPAGTAQYHIDADIVYGLRKYVEATGDHDLLWEIGVEMVVETARLWADLGFYRHGRFHIHGVTGPDEYTALVDDNAYTNAMARMNLRFAAEVVDRLRRERPDRYAELADLLGLTSEEVVEWRLAADAMYIPHDLDLGITPQDDTFLNKEPWDFASTPPSAYPLLLHFHPLVIYRFQVLKQTDVVLADFLLGNEFSPELKKANFDYYEPLTTGDSSLSACIQAIMAAELGYEELAMSHFEHALFMDLADLQGNTTDGVHLASAGGVWMALVYGFAGMRDHGGMISFRPHLPSSWRGMRFRITIRGRRLVVDLDHRRIRFELTGRPLRVEVAGREVSLEQGTTEVQLDSGTGEMVK